jgi:CubicO group peptidase (beta-lactamase class C family)
MPDYSDMRMITDWSTMVREMEKLAPVWEPGRKSGYHGLTFGWILSETASRVDGKTFPQIVQDEICMPLGAGSARAWVYATHMASRHNVVNSYSSPDQK